MISEPNHPILEDVWAYNLIRIDWRPSPSPQETFIDLTFEKGGKARTLRFLSPSCVQVDEGFCGQCSGLSIRDIRCRGWDDIRVAVVNAEIDPGITFLAADVFDLGEQFDRDAATGQLDKLADDANAEHQAGKSTKA